MQRKKEGRVSRQQTPSQLMLKYVNTAPTALQRLVFLLGGRELLALSGGRCCSDDGRVKSGASLSLSLPGVNLRFLFANSSESEAAT